MKNSGMVLTFIFSKGMSLGLSPTTYGWNIIGDVLHIKHILQFLKQKPTQNIRLDKHKIQSLSVLNIKNLIVKCVLLYNIKGEKQTCVGYIKHLY